MSFSWLKYSVLTHKFFTFTEGAITAKLLLGVSQGAPSSKKTPALSPFITFSFGKPCFEPILSQSFQDQAECPGTEFLEEWERRKQQEVCPLRIRSIILPHPQHQVEVANVSHSVLPGLSFVFHRAFLISTV